MTREGVPQEETLSPKSGERGIPVIRNPPNRGKKEIQRLNEISPRWLENRSEGKVGGKDRASKAMIKNLDFIVYTKESN